MVERAIHIGRRVGNYRLIRLLGQGGFAEVYLGEHIHLGTQAAVKLLHTLLAREEVEGFRQEARMIANLLHPHIVRVLDFGVEGNTPYLVMDYAPNGTLRQRYFKGSRLPVATVAMYVKQAAEALQFAHDRRLIHRDIKPENMLLGRQNEVLLGDFGIALSTQNSRYQRTQDVAGTVAYMAPEQIQAHPCPASDQYSLSVVAYEWLTGNRPFLGSLAEVAVKHSIASPPSLCEQVPTLPLAVEQVIMIALSKDPNQRFPTIQAFASALEQASDSSALSSPTFVRPSPSVTAPLAKSTLHFTPQRLDASLPSMNASTFSTSSLHSRAVPEVPVSGVSTPLPLHASRTNLARRALVLGSVSLVTIGGAATAWFLARRTVPSLNNRTFSHSTGNNPLFPSSTPTSASALVTYSGHTDYVWSVDWSPKADLIVSGSGDGTAQIWEAQTGKRVLSYRSHIQPAISNDWVRAVAWSPDGKKIAIGFLDGTVQMLDVMSRALLITYRSSPSPVSAVAWSPDGKLLAIGRNDDQVQVREVATGKTIINYDGHNDFVLTVAWSPDGKRIASGSSDGTAKVWRPNDGRTLLNYTNHSDEVRSVAWSHDNTRIVSSSWDGTAQVWEAESGHTLLTYTKHKGGMVNAVAWSHDDLSIASGGNDVNSHVWEAKTGELMHTYNSYPIFALAWSRDDTRLVTGGYNKIGQVWRVK